MGRKLCSLPTRPANYIGISLRHIGDAQSFVYDYYSLASPPLYLNGSFYYFSSHLLGE